MQTLPKTLSRFIWHFYKKQPIAFLTFYLAPMLLVIDVILFPYALKLIVDILTQHQNIKTEVLPALKPIILLIGLGWLSIVLLIRLQNLWQAYVIPRFQADIRLSVFDYISHHSYRYFSEHFAGELANKVSDLARSLESIRMILNWNIVSALSTATAALILLASIAPVFALIMFVWMVVHLVFSFMGAPYVNTISQRNASDKSRLSGCIVDILSNIIPVKLFSRNAYEYNYVAKQQAVEASSNQALIKMMNLYRLGMDLMVSVMLVFMLYYLIHYWQLEKISTGDFVFVFNIAFAIMNQLWFLGNSMADLFREIGVSRQALSLISSPHEIIDSPEAKNLKIIQGQISFENVNFCYHPGINIFSDKNVLIPAGQKVGLVGLSGSGKSTFVNLLLRFYDIDSGEILIDDQNIACVTQDSLRSSIALIPQSPTLFHRSIGENILYGKVDAEENEVIHAAKLAHCAEFINALPEGYDTLVGERGIKLSGGQRQRIAIARAILKNAPIVILDEATSSLDSITEVAIQESMEQLMQNRTTIVIAHRLSTLSKMDRILVFDNGRIVEDGTHEALIDKQGHYSKLWKMQAGGFLP